VEDLSEDIRAYLRFDEVSARPDNLPRKIWRWTFKHKVTAAFVVLSLITVSLSLAIISLYKQKELIKESRKREMILSGTQSVVSKKAYSIDRLFLNLQNRLESFGNKIIYLLDNPQSKNSKIFSDLEFAKKSSAPPGTVYSSLYKKKVNLNYPVFHAVDNKITPEDKQILASLGGAVEKNMKNDLFHSSPDESIHSTSMKKLEEKALNKGFPIRWLFVGFETGLFVSYPGKTGYPPQYDPRKRPWYKLGQKGRACQWGSPYLDINGLGVMLPGALSLYNDKDNFIGVAGMDVSFDFIKNDLLHSRENGAIKYILDNKGNIVISSSEKNQNIVTDKAGNKTLSLKLFPEADELKDILTKKSGLLETSDSILIFAPIESLGWTYLEKYDKEKLF
jgi:serine/threonine-protein kinase